MHILYVSQYFPPEPGAPAARVSELAAAWVQAGHQVTVLTGMPHHPTGIVPAEYRSRALVTEDFRGVRVVRTWIYAAANRGRVRRSLAYASFAASAALWGQLHVGHPDVVVATSPQFLCAVAGHAIARLRSVPFVFEVRDLWPESIVAVGALPEGHPVVRGLTLVEEHLYRQAVRIVVVTDSFGARLRQRGVPAEKIEVVKNGVDLDRFVPGAHETRLRARLGYDGKFVVSYVGTHGMAHGLDSVLDVAAALRPKDHIRFLFVGEGAERRRLEARAKTECLDNVCFLGVLPRDGMNEVYATSNLCLVPLRKSELFQTVLPSKIFEILGMERPLVLSVDGEARALVAASGGGVFVPPEDVPAMTDAIQRLAQDPVSCRDMGRRGRAYVQENFDRRQLADRYLAILHGIAQPGQA
jgi:colanic acid biosynthesis glycosyl transferase WcaI